MERRNEEQQRLLHQRITEFNEFCLESIHIYSVKGCKDK